MAIRAASNMIKENRELFERKKWVDEMAMDERCDDVVYSKNTKMENRCRFFSLNILPLQK